MRAGDEACPFCGLGRSGDAPSSPAIAPGRSRAQRYALGAAVAASIAVAKADGVAGSPPAAEAADAGSGRAVMVPVASDPEADAEAPLPQEPDRFERTGSPCQRVGGCCNTQVVCPPYGCVFPDEACDLVRA